MNPAVWMSVVLSLVICVSAWAESVRPAEVLSSGQARLSVEPRADGGYGIALKWKSHPTWSQPVPVAVELVTGDGAAKWMESTYQSAVRVPGGISCVSVMTSPNGTRFRLEDTYRVHGKSGAFSMSRKVAVENPSAGDVGFSTRFALRRAGEGIDAYDVLAPGVWYGRNEHAPKHAMGGNRSDNAFYIREDRLSAPFVMAMDRDDRTALSLGHESPDARTFKEEDFLARLVDERMQFGSLGLAKTGDGVSLGFLFPGTEGEKTYIAGGSSERRWAYRSHPVKAGVRHSYSLVLRLSESDDYPEAVRESWRFFYDAYNPTIVRADIPKVYADNVGLLEKYFRFKKGAPGLPFSIGLDGNAGMYTYQMGFVGGQIGCAYHLFRSGVLDNRYDRRKMGEAIIDFWVKNSYDGRSGPDDLPHTWYQPEMSPEAGPGPHWGVMKTERFWRDEPLNGQVFLRTLSEGHLAALKSWELAKDHGLECDSWLAWATRYGDWLVRHQNPDGSYYRKYKVTGEPLELATENTTHPIPFLTAIYRATGDRRYLKAAVSAGEYAWEHSHRPASYVGGTPDNPNVTDKEAAIIALDAFMALHEVTGGRKWLDAATRAADFGETWTYVWDVPMPDGDTEVAAFDKINTAGLSLVATGHSYADYANAASAYNFRRLYELTGDKHYRDFGMLLLHNTKQLLDTDGSKGYAHPGLQVEGIGLSLLRGRGARVWLPWVTLAHIDPIAQR